LQDNRPVNGQQLDANARGRKRAYVYQSYSHGSVNKPATIVFLLAIAILWFAQEPSTIKVDVKLANVFVTVTDEHGAPVAGLKKDDFNLKEEGLE
jgi:hypothetical protein